MPSTRRVKILGVVVLAIVVTILYFTDNARRSNQEFYERTVAAMEAKAAAAVSDEGVSQKLKDANMAAKQAANAEPPRNPPEVVLDTGEKAVTGQKRPKGGEKWDMSTGKESSMGEKEQEIVKTDEEKDVEMELNLILKRSPIIIFSKSYCPYSKKAKRILLNKYTIVPAPFVVELDEHTMGAKLQASLGKSTGRTTVPNVLINGKSIGGGDDIEALDVNGELIDKVKTMGGKRIMEAKKKEGWPKADS